MIAGQTLHSNAVAGGGGDQGLFKLYGAADVALEYKAR